MFSTISSIGFQALTAGPGAPGGGCGLEHRKLVVRRRSATDGRFHDLFLTALGRRVVAKAKSVVAEQEQYMADRLGPRKRDELLNALSTVARLDLRADREGRTDKE